jgi:hypothetical protein
MATGDPSSGLYVILGALISAGTSALVTWTSLSRTAKQERERTKLTKGEELVGLLCDLDSWQPREDQELLTEIANLEAKRTRVVALAITYYPIASASTPTQNSSKTGTSQSLRYGDTQDYSGSSPPRSL